MVIVIEFLASRFLKTSILFGKVVGIIVRK